MSEIHDQAQPKEAQSEEQLSNEQQENSGQIIEGEILENTENKVLEGTLENESEVSETGEFDVGEKAEGVSVKILTDFQRQIDQLQKEKAGATDSVLRTQAEMENLRRRVDRDVENAHKYALEKFIAELLPVVDSLERGIETVPEEDEAQKAAREGLILTLKMLTDSLAKFNVESIDPTGTAFDPQFHEAMAQVPQADTPPNVVINTVQKGYSLNGRLVRPAMVVVSK